MAEKIDKAKKRKRQAEDSSKPSKKVAIERAKNIQISLPETDKWAPIIASTPGLTLPSAIPLQPYTKPRPKTSHNPSSGVVDTTEFLLHSNSHPKLDYIAREEELGAAGTLRKHYVGVFDPETGNLQIVEGRKMIVRGIVRAHQAGEDDETLISRAEQRNEQVEAFGTKKAKKALASKTENAIGPARAVGTKAAKVDRAATAILASMADAAANMATRDQLSEAADAAKPRPKADLTATVIQDVYTIDSLIGDDVFQYLEVLDWQEAVKKGQQVIVSSRYVAGRIQALSSHIEKLKILRYTQLLIDFYKSSKAGGRGKTRKLAKREDLRKALGNTSDTIVDSIKRKFSASGEISAFNVDLLITHIAALACLVDSFEVDMWDLRQDLDLEARQMQQYFQEIGAKIRSFPEALRKKMELDKSVAAQRKIAKLNLPLEFPKVSFGRRV